MHPEGTGSGIHADYEAWLQSQDPARLTEKMQDAENVFRRTGITFAVYGEEEAAERLIPFDIVPRIISGGEWRKLTQGIEQRVQALNAFLDDIYHRQEILRAGRIPRELIAGNEAFLPKMIGGHLRVCHAHHWRRYRTHSRERLRARRQCPYTSGVTYMIENREIMMQLFPELFQTIRVRPVKTIQVAAVSSEGCARRRTR